MSSSAGPARIILPIEIELDNATAQLRGFRRTAVDELAPAAKGVEVELTKVETAATKAGTAGTKAADGMKNEMRGAGAAVGGVMQAITLLGANAPPQIGGIARAFSSLIVTGTGPIGLVIAGVTALIALFASTASESDKLTKAIDRQAEAQRALNERLRERERIGTGATKTLGRGPTDGQIDASRIDEMLGGNRADMVDALYTARDTTRSNPTREAARQRVLELQNEHAELLRIAEDLKTIADRQERVWNPTRSGPAAITPNAEGLMSFARSRSRGTVNPLWTDKNQQLIDAVRGPGWDRYDAMLGELNNNGTGSRLTLPASETEQGIQRAIDARLKSERELASIQTGTSVRILELTSQIVEKERELVNLKRLAPEATEEADARERELAAMRGQLDVEKEIGKGRIGPQSMKSETVRGASYTEQLDRQLQSSTESAVTQGIADALSPDRNKGAFERFALAMADTLRTRIAQGLADALLGNGKNFGGGGLLGSIFGGGAGGNNADGTGPFGGSPAPSGAEVVGSGTTTYYSTPLGPGKRAMKAEDSTPIVVMVGVDEASADHILSKASGRGARAVYVKSQGGGVGAGMIPGRRK